MAAHLARAHVDSMVCINAGSMQRDALLSEVEVRRALAMLAYQEEWKSSLAESHRDDASRDALLADFAGKIDIMRQALAALGVGDMNEVQQSAANIFQKPARSVWF